MLAYDTSADQLDEVLMIGVSAALECLGKFVQGVIDKFGAEYFRPPHVKKWSVYLKLVNLVASLAC